MKTKRILALQGQGAGGGKGVAQRYRQHFGRQHQF